MSQGKPCGIFYMQYAESDVEKIYSSSGDYIAFGLGFAPLYFYFNHSDNLEELDTVSDEEDDMVMCINYIQLKKSRN